MRQQAIPPDCLKFFWPDQHITDVYKNRYGDHKQEDHICSKYWMKAKNRAKSMSPARIRTKVIIPGL